MRVPALRIPTIRVLLLQARDPEDPARDHELAAFSAKLGYEPDQIRPYDLLAGPPSAADLRGIDALMVGGSGDYFVSRGNLPHAREFSEFLAERVEGGFPLFASCFGFQCLVEALGGEIVHDPECMEVGSYELQLTAAGREDPLLGHLPARFCAQLGRKDRAARLPQGVLGLAQSAHCPYQALRVEGRPVWATQFHPELDMQENRHRYMLYLEAYSEGLSEEERRAAFERFRPCSPQVLELLPRFVQLVFG